MTDISSINQVQIFICEHCQKSFKKRNKLGRHIKETHLNLKEFCCSLCNKTFKRNSHLKRHMVIHSTEPKPFKCLYDDCLLRFSDKYHLERHIKVKHKNMKFECNGCGLSFDKKLYLFKHNFQSHHMEKPFKCFHNSCLKSFYTQGTLAKHEKHHEFPFKKMKNSNKPQFFLSQNPSSAQVLENFKEFNNKFENIDTNNCFLSPIEEDIKEENNEYNHQISSFFDENINTEENKNEIQIKETKNENLENDENFQMKKSKLIDSHFSFTCVEENCGKTYSTVNFIFI